MLKKTTVNPQPPMVDEGKAHGAGAPKTRPNLPGSAAGHVLVSEASGGSKGAGSTFRAPRQGESMDPYACGYTKPGKM